MTDRPPLSPAAQAVLDAVITDSQTGPERFHARAHAAAALPADIARCRGFGDGPEGWLEECHDCQRRTAAGGEVFMEPPTIITFFCEFVIPGDES